MHYLSIARIEAYTYASEVCISPFYRSTCLCACRFDGSPSHKCRSRPCTKTLRACIADLNNSIFPRVLRYCCTPRTLKCCFYHNRNILVRTFLRHLHKSSMNNSTVRRGCAIYHMVLLTCIVTGAAAIIPWFSWQVTPWNNCQRFVIWFPHSVDAFTTATATFIAVIEVPCAS